MKKMTMALIMSAMLAPAGFSAAVTPAKPAADLPQRVAELEKKVAELEKIIEPIRQQQEAMRKIEVLRRKAFDRARLDLKKYPQDQLKAMETEYQEIARKLGAPEGKELLKKFIRKYPDSNRAGCALLYLANLSSGDEADKYFMEAIAKNSDCWYFDGVQVGAYARFLLGMNLWKAGKKKEAEALFAELRKNYPDAISHRGQLLSDMIPRS